MFARSGQNYFASNTDDASMWLPQGVLDDLDEPQLTRFEPPAGYAAANAAAVEAHAAQAAIDGRMRSKVRIDFQILRV